MKRTAIAFLALTFATVVHANADDAFHAQGVFCNTLEQAQAFLTTFDGTNLTEAISTANAGLKTEDGCGTAEILATVQESYGEYTNSLGTWQYVKLDVLAQFDEDGFHTPKVPVYQYTAIKVGDPGTDI